MAKKGKPAGLPARRIEMADIALGSYEAACVTGTQWSRPAKLAKEGKLVYRPLESGWSLEKKNEFFLYSLRDCDENYRDYLESVATGSLPGRKRSEECIAQREPMLARLREVEQILYDDAIGTSEAATILGVHITMVNRMVREGKLRARKAFNDRHGEGKGSVYIVSRRACEENRHKYAALEASGTKTGMKRSPGKRTVARTVPPKPSKKR
jgi:hypothetical protein